MRPEKFYANSTYHVCSTGIESVDLFADEIDCTRFIFLATHLQSPIRMHNVFWYVDSYKKRGAFLAGENKQKEILKNRNVELLAFALTQNSFDLVIKNLEEMALSVYMQRLLTGYSKYYNAKYKRSGHVFSGIFRSKQIKSETDLLSTSAIIHKKPFSKQNPSGRLEGHRWSSHTDYTDHNRWGDLLNTKEILGIFKNPGDYKKFVMGHDTES